jgi:C-terminal processing protease CtpA/Prc
MKTFTALTFVFLFLSIHSFSQTKNFEPDKIATFCKVWGFLKYHHPAVAKGKYDWDKVFLEKINTVETLNGKEELNNFYYNWITGLGKLKTHSARTPPKDAILSNYDSTWYKDTSAFSDKVVDLLTRVKNNSRSKNHYVKKKFFGLSATSYENENLYKDSMYPFLEMRLLILSRYWNIVNYFYPYKYLTDTHWQDVLTKFIPEFIKAKNSSEYRLNLAALFAKLNDSHTGVNRLYDSSGPKLPSFNNRIIDNKIVTLDAFNDSICKKEDIRYGDVILKINGQSVTDRISYKSKYVSASNPASLYDLLTPDVIWTGLEYPATVTCIRDGDTLEKRISAYSYDVIFPHWQNLRHQSAPNKYKILENNIAYVNLGNLKSKKEAKKMLKKIKSTKGTILDIRNYPNGSIFNSITNFFCTSKNAYAKIVHQSIKYPGALTYTRTLHCGKNKGASYNGKVVVLTNETTASFAELFTMALKTIPGVIIIGNHTAGADGSNNAFGLQGNIITSFSNEAVYYPDGKQTQRIGIVPDIKVLPTIEGVRLKKDEALDKAIEVLSKA